MIRKINNDKNFQHRHLSDVERIQSCCLQHGYEADLKECADIWNNYSNMFAAGWMGLPNDDEELWNCIIPRIETNCD